MHPGVISALRLYMIGARPWQQVLICLVLVAVGIMLLVFDQWSGVALVSIGFIFGFPVVGVFIRRSRIFLARSTMRVDELREKET